MKYLLHILCAFASLFGNRAMAQDNVVILFIDQLSYWATDPAQQAPLQMPNLDALAAQGTTFTRAYATSPVCSAARLSLITGRYPFFGTDRIDPAEDTLGTILEGAGWDTSWIGKHHLSQTPDPSGYVPGPDRRGFRHFFGAWGQPHKYVTGVAFRNNDPSGVPTGPFEPTTYANEAIRFIKAQRNKPYALVLALDPPHPTKDHALMPPDIYTPGQITLRPNVPASSALLAKAKYATYLSWCALTDIEIGRVLAEVDLSTTFVLLLSDHGDMLYSHGTAGNQQKRSPYSEASQVPMILAGPGISAGVTDPGMMSTVDVLPSLLSLLGVPIPAQVQGGVFAYFTPILFGQDDGSSAWRGLPWRGLISSNLKYARSEDGFEVLFDLNLDEYELTNLATDPVYQPTLSAMRAAMAAESASIGDPFN